MTLNLEAVTAEIDAMPEPDQEQKARKSQAAEIVAFVQQRAELFHDQNKDVYAKLHDDRSVRRIDSRGFGDWITAEFYRETNRSVRDQSLREARATLNGTGRHHGECRAVFNRVAKHGNAYLIDLAQPGNSLAVKVQSGHWEIVSDPPVDFIRPETMHPLPVPVGGDVGVLWDLCNVPEHSRLLTIAYLVEVWRPDTPYPVYETIGEQGCGKSQTQTKLKRVVDPSSCDLRASPKNNEDVFVGAGANHVISFENVSHLSPAIQDAFCIVSTGGSHVTRRLYTNNEEAVIHAHNPIMLNGIVASVTQQDLVDRTITVELPVITEREESGDLNERFDALHANIFGALLDIFAKALAALPRVLLPKDERPRLVEFARLGMAVALAMDSSPSKFMEEFNASRQEALARTIDASPVATALIDWFDSRGKDCIEMALKELLANVEAFKPQGTDAWPRTPKGFGDALRRVAPALRQLGIECRSMGKIGGVIRWRIERKINSSTRCPESPESPRDENLDNAKQDMQDIQDIDYRSLFSDSTDESDYEDF